MNKVLVAELGVEGGSCSIYGREADGSWAFWREGLSLDFDENDEEVVRSCHDLELPARDAYSAFLRGLIEKREVRHGGVA